MDHENQLLYPVSSLPHVTEGMAANSASPQFSSVPQSAVPTMHVLLGPENTVTTCQFCAASIKTAIRYTTTSRTYIAAALCSLLGCCCCIPLCSDSAKNTDHYCPNCQRYLGTYEK